MSIRGTLTVVVALLVAGCSSGSDTVTEPTSSTTATTPAAGGGEGAEALTTRWVESMSGPSAEDEIDGVAAGPDGSAYVTGKFERSTTIGGTELVAQGAADIPLARFAPDGTLAWVKRFGGPGEDNFFDIDANDDGAVASGIIEGTVAFGSVELTSVGSTDCAVVSFDPDGSTRWARSLGGPGPDGCNEITIGPEGEVVTSLDTAGGWESPAGWLPAGGSRDTVLVRFGRDGTTDWGQLIGGPGSQRGKSLAVGVDGDVAFGGDTVGGLALDGRTVTAPGGRKDAWASRWSSDGDLEWVEAWGGPGDDIAKGLAVDGDATFAVGSFTSTVEVGGVVLDAGDVADLAVIRFDAEGDTDWATTVSAADALGGAEIISVSDGGILFAGPRVPDLSFGSPSGAPTTLDDANGGTAWLVHYRPDGSVAFASTIAGTADARPGEIARVGTSVFLEIAIRGAENLDGDRPLPTISKDGSLWALDVPSSGS